MLIRRERPERRAAFTLMEMLIVVAIIVMLAGIGGYFAINQYQEAKLSQAKIGARKIGQALEAYKIQHDTYPVDLSALLAKTEIGGPYLTNRSDIIDPWGNPYGYDAGGGRNTEAGALIIIADVFATAPDGRVVGNWDKK